MVRVHCWIGHANPVSCRPPCKHPTQGVPEPGFPFFLGRRRHQSALPSHVPIVPIAQWSRRIFYPLPCLWGCMCWSSMAKASRGCFQLLLRVVSSEEAIRTSIAKVGRRLSLREQSIVKRVVVVVSGLSSRKLMHSLESLGVNCSANATRSSQRRGLSLAVGTHRLGHCTSGVAWIYDEVQACGRNLSDLTRII